MLIVKKRNDLKNFKKDNVPRYEQYDWWDTDGEIPFIHKNMTSVSGG